MLFREWSLSLFPTLSPISPLPLQSKPGLLLGHIWKRWINTDVFGNTNDRTPAAAATRSTIRRLREIAEV